jgi:aspartyl-tRNA(Asn)/glutamyl-tRNA(Gln) amidotransferase subunit C
MALSEKDVLRIAELSRLEITSSQVPKMLGQLNAVFALVEQLAAVDTTGVEPLTHINDAVLRLRADAVTESDHRAAYQTVAPATDAGLYLVPRVIE